MKNNMLLFILFVISTLIVFISPFLTSETVNNVDDLKTVALGFPIPFVTQDLSAYDPPFPYEMSLSSPWENPIKSINVVFLFVSVLIVMAPLLIVNYCFKRMKKSD